MLHQLLLIAAFTSTALLVLLLTGLLMLIVNIFRITEAVAGVAAAFYCCFTASVPWELFLIVDASAFIALMLQAAVQLILLSLWLLRQLISK